MSGSTGSIGGGQSFYKLQPSLAVTELTLTAGIFPSGGGGGSASGDVLGFVYNFAGNFAPAGSVLLQGQLLSISANPVLFNLLGTTYGGDGASTFALPDLQGTAMMGMGSGPGLPTETEGVPTGSANVTLNLSQIPVHNYPLPGGGFTGNVGGGQSYSNLQPSLPVETLIATGGVFPSQGGSSGSATFIGQVANFEGNFIPAGWTAADGQLLSIQSNQALFAIIGTTYGGDGVTTFALPDLQGRVAVGADATDPLGTEFGSASNTLTVAQLPPNALPLPGGGSTDTVGGGQPVSNDQPSLALNYLIATSGIFPSEGSGSSFSSTTPTLGQIVAFAGNFAPSGWAFANGQLLSIQQNAALFSVIGTTYGGNGTTTFALPDLRGRTLVGTGTNSATNYTLGGVYGADTTTLTVANLPVESASLACFAVGTHIATPAGKVPVEALTIGDRVLSRDGMAHPIVWIGFRRVDCRRHAKPAAVLPVCIAADAFAPGCPSRDLYLSPDHAVWFDGVLIPVKHLVNGRTVRQVTVPNVTYFHVELARHDILLAEDLPVESYLDTGDRSAFANGGAALPLHAEFGPATKLAWLRWEAEGCAPLMVVGPSVDRARALLRRRAGMTHPVVGSRPPRFGTAEPVRFADVSVAD